MSRLFPWILPACRPWRRGQQSLSVAASSLYSTLWQQHPSLPSSVSNRCQWLWARWLCQSGVCQLWAGPEHICPCSDYLSRAHRLTSATRVYALRARMHRACSIIIGIVFNITVFTTKTRQSSLAGVRARRRHSLVLKFSFTRKIDGSFVASETISQYHDIQNQIDRQKREIILVTQANRNLKFEIYK